MDKSKVEQIIGIIDSKSWPVVDANAGGELVLVDVPGRPGAKQKMNKAEAIRLGLWKETEDEGRRTEENAARKARSPARNKARKPGQNKDS